MTATEALFEKAATGAELTDGERSALVDTPDLLGLGMAADEARRRRHGRRMTFVRVATLDINTVDAATTTWPDAAGELRLTGTPADWTAAIASVQALAGQAAGRVPITGFSLADLEAAGARIVAQLKGAGLAAAGDAPIDRLRDPEAALSMANDAGLAVLRLTVARAPASVRRSLLDLARSLTARWPSIQAFAPLPLIAGDAPSTGYEDVRMVALARLLVDVPHVQVDWSLYGPKLAQVALTFGGDDVDGVSAVDDMSLGRRRAPLEEIRRNIVAASGEPAERDGLFGQRS